MFAAANKVLDCSAPPCILLVDMAPGLDAWDVTCGPSFSSTMVNREQGYIYVHLFVDAEGVGEDVNAQIEERFEREAWLRRFAAQEQLIRQRSPGR